MNLIVYCYNRILEFRIYIEFEVVNLCFWIDECFDRKYLMFEIVMDVFVIEDIVIYVRLVLICKEMVLFEWRVEYVEFVIEG